MGHVIVMSFDMAVEVSVMTSLWYAADKVYVALRPSNSMPDSIWYDRSYEEVVYVSLVDEVEKPTLYSKVIVSVAVTLCQLPTAGMPLVR